MKMAAAVSTTISSLSTRPSIIRYMAHHRQHHHVRYTRQHHRRTKSTDGYKSFGSFHSDNVEELIRLPKDQYTPPKLPFDVSEESRLLTPPTSSSINKPFANSDHYIKSYSHLDRNNWTFLNHGAFGLALDIGLHRANLWRTYLESQPLRYFDRYLLNHLTHSARMMAEFVTQNEEDASKVREGIALIQNATSGMNAVIGGHARCANYMNNRRFVFYYDIAYGSNKKMCQRYHGNENAIAIPFEDDFLPLLQKVTTSSNSSLNRMDNDWNSKSAEVFIKALDIIIHKLIKHGDKSSVNGSLLILDHITSNTAIHMPICAIAKYAKEEYGMTVVVDGAHSLLSLPLDMSTILSTGEDDTCGHVDVYLTNANKWFSSPRGAALLFCTNPEIRDTILAQPAVISHGVDDGFLSRFMWDGCRDYSAQLSLPSILNYWSTANIDNVRREMQTNLEEGVRILISHWHPDSDTSSHDMKYLSEQDITLVPLQIHAPMMALVRLPYHISGGDGEQKTSTDAKRLQDFLYNHNLEVPVKCIRGKLYARVSCHVYNTEGEFIRLAEVALKYSLR